MTAKTIMLAVPAVLGLAALPAAANTTICNEAGPIVSCSDGAQYYTFGNRTTDNRGNIWLHDREFTFGSNGTIIQRAPGNTYDPDPFAWPPYGTGPLGSQPGAVPGNVYPRPGR